MRLLIVHFICLSNCCCSHPLLLYSTIRVIGMKWARFALFPSLQH
jgi:hypothetical protein